MMSRVEGIAPEAVRIGMQADAAFNRTIRAAIIARSMMPRVLPACSIR